MECKRQEKQEKREMSQNNEIIVIIRASEKQTRQMYLGGGETAFHFTHF